MIKPTLNRIIISPTKAELQTTGGLFLPANSDKNTGFGEVVAIGKDVTTLEVGDKIFYDLKNTISLSYQGQSFHLTEDTYVMAKQ
jgi:co-chaperonin GroES (HSP10)